MATSSTGRHNPYEANLGRVVKLDKGEFVGRAALAAVEQAGPRRKLVGLVMRDNAIARAMATRCGRTMRRSGR